ncbi:MAG: decarboxylase [Nanoarchaeota archaeon]|nr:decarboxylase [Nanoarchaeota archaeon]
MLTAAHFELSKKKVLEKYVALQPLCDIVSYSHKTNPEISKILSKETKCMFSVHTVEDIPGLDPARLWFFAQAWDKKELDLLFQKKVSRFVVDNKSDLDILLSYIKRKKGKTDLLLRMKLKENTVHTGKHYVYGMHSDEVNTILKELRKNKSIGLLGIHFHRKTQNVSEWGLIEELEDSIEEENWKNIDFVNIGGGIPSLYKNFSESAIIGIFDKIKELKAWLNTKGAKVIIEPGRYIASYPVKLVANVKAVYDDNLVIDCSVYNAAMDTFVAHIRLIVEGELEEGEGIPYIIKGCTPDSMDIFRYRVYLNKVKPGDKIVFLNAGAYTYTTDFCNLPKLKTVLVD